MSLSYNCQQKGYYMHVSQMKLVTKIYFLKKNVKKVSKEEK